MTRIYFPNAPGGIVRECLLEWMKERGTTAFALTEDAWMRWAGVSTAMASESGNQADGNNSLMYTDKYRKRNLARADRNLGEISGCSGHVWLHG